MSGKLSALSCKAARGILDWSQKDLAREAGVGPGTIVKLENGEGIRDDAAARILECFAANGVLLLNGSSPGARLRKD